MSTDRANRSWNRWLAAVIASGVLFVLAGIVTLYVFETFTAYKIPSDAMAPTLPRGSRVLTHEVTWRAVQRGDIVVYKSFAPVNAPARVSRVVAIGGDRVETVGGRVLVNGKPEHSSGVTGSTTIEAPVVVPAGAVYLLGDNRANSRDSRADGTLPAQNITAQVRYVNVPVDWIALGVTLFLGVLFVVLLIVSPFGTRRRVES